MTFAVASLLILQTASDESWDAAHFRRVMDSLHAPVRDVTCVFEGGMEWLEKNQGSSRYQGLYSFRADGATLLDVFNYDSRTDKPGMRSVTAILNGHSTATSQVIDVGTLNPERGGAHPGMLNKPGSAERILYYWFFRTLPDAAYGYKFLGWEIINRHKCLKVQFYQVPESALAKTKDKPIVRFWIDLERGGHPLRIEFHSGDNLVMRTDVSDLRKHPVADGSIVWLPVRAETNAFAYDTGKSVVRNTNKPYIRETYAIVDGSVLINQGLNDKYFTLDLERTLPQIGSLQSFQRTIREVPALRTDPVGVKLRLDEQLAKADQQSKQLEASAAAREDWDMTTVLQSVLLGSGLLAIGIAGFKKWKSG